MSNETAGNKNTENTEKACEKIAYLAVDIGTTNLKCSLYDENLIAIKSHCYGVNLKF